MSQQATPVTMTEPVRPAAWSLSLAHWYRTYMDLAKARLSALVVITTLVGFLLGSGASIEWATLLWTVIGTSLAAASANALNQVIEIERDRLMHRTRTRPLPAGRISPMHAAIVAVLAGGWGVTLLAAFVNPLTAGLALLTILLYLLAYTPLKTRTTLNTLVGGVVGAIPPMMGWAAATGRIDTGAWVLFAVLFAWQIPHFLALAWMYRDDYERGGYRMLPIIDPSGVITCRAIVMWCLAMLPITLAATLVGVTGMLYAAGAVVLGIWLLKLGVDLQRQRTDAQARRLFIASVLYLPLLMGLMLLDRGPLGDRPASVAPITITPPAVTPQLPAAHPPVTPISPNADNRSALSVSASR